MKKFIFTLMLLMMSVLSINAQIATENSKVFDNIGIGMTAGVTSPLDMNSIFPINPTFGFVATKGITPELAAQLEVITGLGDNHFTDVKTAFKNLNIGLNGSLNVPNIFLGYKGQPRLFEPSIILGLGVRHADGGNNLLAKTGVDFAFNIGKKKAHSIVFTPAIYWGLKNGSNLQFNQHNALVSLMATYVYHFKNSNGTHSFKTYDIAALTEHKPHFKQHTKVVEKHTETVVDKTFVTNKEWIVQFAQGSSELTDGAKFILDQVKTGLNVDIIGTASPEGDGEFNQRISEKRAAVVADYLIHRGVRVNSSVGKGVQFGRYTNRLAIITVKQ